METRVGRAGEAGDRPSSSESLLGLAAVSDFVEGRMDVLLDLDQDDTAGLQRMIGRYVGGLGGVCGLVAVDATLAGRTLRRASGRSSLEDVCTKVLAEDLEARFAGLFEREHHLMERVQPLGDLRSLGRGQRMSAVASVWLNVRGQDPLEARLRRAGARLLEAREAGRESWRSMLPDLCAAVLADVGNPMVALRLVAGGGLVDRRPSRLLGDEVTADRVAACVLGEYVPALLEARAREIFGPRSR